MAEGPAAPAPAPMPGQGPTVFVTTRWTLVLAAGDDATARDALEQLCRIYWFPLYAYVRRRGHDAHAAQDLTQGFFARLLERNDLARLTREGGRFRSFLLTALNHYLANEHERATAWKRGGRVHIVSRDDGNAEDRYLSEPVDTETPDRLFDRRWALALMEEALVRLAREQAEQGRQTSFDRLRPFLSREPAPGEYARLARDLDMAPGTLAVQVHRLRERFRIHVRAAVADTVDNPLEVAAEMRHLLAALGSD